MKTKIIILLALCITSLSFAQKDVANSKDYYLLERMPDYYISSYEDTEFDKFGFYTGEEKEYKEGRKFVIRYTHNNL